MRYELSRSTLAAIALSVTLTALSSSVGLAAPATKSPAAASSISLKATAIGEAQRKQLAPLVDSLLTDPTVSRNPSLTVSRDVFEKVLGVKVQNTFVSAAAPVAPASPLPNWKDITSAIPQCDPKTHLTGQPPVNGAWPPLKALIDAGKIDQGLLTWINYCVDLCEKKSKITADRKKPISCAGLKAAVPPNNPQNQKTNEELLKQIDENIRVFTDIIKVEEMYGAQCFFGPDNGHQQKIDESQNGLRECMRVRTNFARIMQGATARPTKPITVTPVNITDPANAVVDGPWWIICTELIKPVVSTGGKIIQTGEACLIRGSAGMMWFFPVELLPGQLQPPSYEPGQGSLRPL